MKSKVKIERSSISIPTYNWSGYGDEPPLARDFTPRRQNIYPYSLLEKIAETAQNATYDTIVMENELLKLTFIPSLNGRLYAVFDKTNKVEVLYKNPQLKPALFGLRGAWCANGMEYNFPNSHSVTTLEPVDCELLEKEDGSAVFRCGNRERVSGMVWNVSVTLRPGSAAIEVVTDLHNPTDTPHPYYYWLNVAAPLYPDTKFVYPRSTTRLYTHPPMDISRLAYVDYPLHHGVDISLFANIHQHFPIFAETMREDFFGVYHSEHDVGLVNFADHSLVRGRKIWMFGNARDGKVWIDQLTDSGGDYCELQTGPFSLQSDYRLMEPNSHYRQKELWMPIGKIDGFNAVTPKIVANVLRDGRRCRVLLNPIEDISNVEIALETLDERLAATKTDLKAMKVEELVFETSKDNFNLRVTDGDGRTLLRHRHRSSSPKGNAEDNFSYPEHCAEARYLKARYQEEQGYPRDALKTYSEDRDNLKSRIAIARLELDAGLYESAAEKLTEVTRMNVGDGEAFYYLGVACKRLGEFDRAEHALSRCRDNLLMQSNALIQLTEISIMRKEYRRAAERIEAFSSVSQPNVKSLALTLLLKRKLGENLTKDMLEATPLSPLINGEKLLNGNLEKSRLTVQMVVDAAAEYMALREYEDANSLIKKIIDDVDAPLLYYYAGHIARELESPKEAEVYFRKAAASEGEMEFESRLISADVLRTAVSFASDDEKAIYHLANILASRDRWNEAVNYYGRIKGELRPVALRNLALHYWKHVENGKSDALALFEQASKCENVSTTILCEYDNLLAECGEHDKRLQLLNKHRHREKEDSRLLLHRIESMAVNGVNCMEAFDLLMNNKFSLAEGRSGPRILFEDLCCGIGDEALSSEDYATALAFFEKPMEYPEILGSGKPAANQEAEWCFRCAEVHRIAGNLSEAEKALRRGIEEASALKIEFFPLKRVVPQHESAMIELPIWINEFFRGLCAIRLGENVLAEKIAERMRYMLCEKKADGGGDTPEEELLEMMRLTLSGVKVSDDFSFDESVIPYRRIVALIRRLDNGSVL